jgi:hypothetical protein
VLDTCGIYQISSLGGHYPRLGWVPRSENHRVGATSLYGEKSPERWSLPGGKPKSVPPCGVKHTARARATGWGSYDVLSTISKVVKIQRAITLVLRKRIRHFCSGSSPVLNRECDGTETLGLCCAELWRNTKPPASMIARLMGDWILIRLYINYGTVTILLETDMANSEFRLQNLLVMKHLHHDASGSSFECAREQRHVPSIIPRPLSYCASGTRFLERHYYMNFAIQLVARRSHPAWHHL